MPAQTLTVGSRRCCPADAPKRQKPRPPSGRGKARSGMEIMSRIDTVSDIDGARCELIERVPGKVSGRPTVRGTRIIPEAIIGSYDLGETIEELCAGFPIYLPPRLRALSNLRTPSVSATRREGVARRKPQLRLTEASGFSRGYHRRLHGFVRPEKWRVTLEITITIEPCNITSLSGRSGATCSPRGAAAAHRRL